MSQPKCATCGVPLASGALRGNCPRCLLELAAGPAPATAPLPDISPKPVRFFGDYELQRELARGGMGVVFAARQVSLNRPVALKMIAAGQLATPAAVQRFRLEAEAAARLSHPNIVAIYEVGEHEGQHFFSMELALGGTLADQIAWRRNHEEGLGASVVLMVKVARAVHYAHRRGVLHRDLKPTNVLLDDQGEPRVTDFGLAKILEGDDSLTQSAATLGTPAYMSPEQAAGHVKLITTATDVYGLGAIFYELLTGQPPFRAATALETMRLVVETEPARPRTLNPNVDADLETICLKCLNKEPSVRYDSAGALAADLERWLRGEPIRTRPASAAEKFRRWCGRKPALAGLGAGVVGLLLVVVIGSPLAAWRMDHLRARAEAEALEARRNLYVADMTLAEQACAVGDFGRAIELLEHHRPEANLPGAITRAQPDLRGWEWRYLWQLTRSDELATLGRHGSLVRALVFSPNGQTLASGGVNNIVRLWDVNMRRETASATLPAWISGLSYSPDGKWLVAASGRTQLTIWEAGSLREITTLRAINLSLTSTFSGDGTLLIAAAGGELKCWEAGSWKERPAILWEGSATNLPLVERVTLAPDNRMLAFNSEDGRIYLWDMERRQVVAVWPGHKPLQGFATMQALVYSPDGRMLVSAGADNQIIVWDPATRQQRRVLVLPKIGGREFWPHALAFSPDGKLLASAGANQRLALWDTTNWQLANVLKGHQDGVWSVAFSPDGRTLASGSKDETIRLWNPDAKPPDSPFHEFPDGTVTGMTSTDGRSELTLQKDSTAILRESASLREIARWPTARLNGVSARALSGGAKHVAFGYADGLISLSDAHNGRNLASWQAHEAKVHRLGFSLDATLLASVGEDGKLSLWDVATQRERWSAKLTSAITSPYTSLIFAPDNMRLFWGDTRGDVRIWDCRSGNLIQKVHAYEGRVTGMAISADGWTLATCSSDGPAKLWSLAAPAEPLNILGAGYRSLYGVALSPDGRRCAIYSGEGNVNVWDLVTAQKVATLAAHSDLSAQMVWLPDGDTVLLATAKGTFVWHAPTFAEISQAEAP